MDTARTELPDLSTVELVWTSVCKIENCAMDSCRKPVIGCYFTLASRCQLQVAMFSSRNSFRFPFLLSSLHVPANLQLFCSELSLRPVLMSTNDFYLPCIYVRSMTMTTCEETVFPNVSLSNGTFFPTVRSLKQENRTIKSDCLYSNVLEVLRSMGARRHSSRSSLSEVATNIPAKLSVFLLPTFSIFSDKRRCT